MAETCLTLMTGLDIPADICVEVWPPEPVWKAGMSGEDALMAKRIMCLPYEIQSLLFFSYDQFMLAPAIVPP